MVQIEQLLTVPFETLRNFENVGRKHVLHKMTSSHKISVISRLQRYKSVFSEEAQLHGLAGELAKHRGSVGFAADVERASGIDAAKSELCDPGALWKRSSPSKHGLTVSVNEPTLKQQANLHACRRAEAAFEPHRRSTN